MNVSPSSKVADSGVILSWTAWFVSHIDQINGVVQFFALLFAIAASITAIIYHVKRIK